MSRIAVFGEHRSEWQLRAYSVEKLQFRAWRTDFFAIPVD
jgi:hypothetical protein